jgi:Lipase (class 3)
MLQADRISDAFKGGPADPNRSFEDLERFYQQAKWLGECAEYIYPPPIDHSDDAQMAKWELIWNSFLEQHSDATLMSADAKAYREKWENAINEFVEKLQNSSNPDATSEARVTYEGLDENGLDAIADALQSKRLKLFPTLRPWKWFSVTEPMRLATLRYELAHRLWSTRAESRIREYIDKTWAAEGTNSGGNTTVDFKSKNGIEYFMASNDKMVILCFRGTEMHKMGDIITDMRAWQVEVPERKKKPTSDDANANKKTQSQSAKFHEGFWSALHGVWEQIEQNPVWEAFKSPTKKQVWITGHSLGGALATVAAYRLVRDEVISADQISGVFTFGQPRVGDGKFVGGYSGTRDRHYRFVNNCDIVTMIPPKSIRWVFRLGSMFFKQGASKQQAGAQGSIVKVVQTDSETLMKSYDYADVGNILFLNRSSRVTLLRPKLLWPFDLFFGRVGSLLRSPFVNTKHRSLMERIVPGVADHSMQEYNRVLKIACAHCEFVREAVAKMKERPELKSRQESSLKKAAEQAWTRLRASADRVAWDAKKQVLTPIAVKNVELKKLKRDKQCEVDELKKQLHGKGSEENGMTDLESPKLKELAVRIATVQFELSKLNKSNAVVWLDTWQAVLSEKRGQAIENAMSSLRKSKLGQENLE